MTKPLTGDKLEIAILHAEARLDAELIEEFKGKANQYSKAIERMRELVHKFEQEPQDEMVNYHLIARRILTALNNSND